ncbi:acyl-CoA dehydrogenase family protein [Alicycliphilus denitrificans]|uniref:acyl-CoA dehydrogenase family protein n=1 Tax=Alicycliphilus denitrificans TaxID=179636 RepID=UPI0038504BA1
MNFELNDEQRMLEEAVSKLVAGKLRSEPPVFTVSDATWQQRWQQLAELGVAGLLVHPEHGGAGMGVLDAVVVARALGRGNARQPFAVCAASALWLLDQAAAPAFKAQWLAKACAGEVLVTLAVDDDNHRPQPPGVRLEGGALHGRKSAVVAAGLAQWLIVAAQDAAGATQLLAVPADHPAVRIDSVPQLDGHNSAEVQFNGVPLAEVEQLGAGADADALLAQALDIGRVVLCAEALGLMESLWRQTVDYLKERRQFKQPLIQLQVLQHRLVDMLMAVESAHSATLLGAASLHEAAAERSQQVALAKCRIGRYAVQVAEQATQCFGGMGVTDEFESSHYTRRLHTIDMTWGNADEQLRRYAARM